MTEHITVSRELLRQVIECEASEPEKMYRLKKQLRAALEQPAVEPYGWHVTGGNELLRGEYAQSDDESDAQRCGGTTRAVAVYTSPTPPADVPLLTDEEVQDAIRHIYKYDVVLIATFRSSIADFRAIEQAVRQKAGLKS